MSENDVNNEVISEEKSKKKRATAEDKLKVLLDNQMVEIEKMIDQKLDHYNYRMFNSFKAEFRRWWNGYYDNFK